MKLPRWARRLATALLVAAAAWYLFDSVADNWGALRRYRWEVDPLLLAASVGAHVGVLAFGVWIWERVLRRFEHPPVRLGTLLRIWFLSNLARYVPGKIFQFVAVAQLSRAAGLSGAVLLTSMLVQTALSLLAAAVLAAWTLGAGFFPALSFLWIGLAATAFAVVLVHPDLLNAVLGLLPRLFKREVIRWNGGWAEGVGLLGLAVVNWVMYGGAYYLFLRSLAEVPAQLLPQLAGVNALSFLAGYVAFVTPGGLGVREVTMKALLDPYVPGGVAAVLAVASRLWTVAAELIGGALAVIGARRHPAAVPPPGD
ncbi:MAG TPA: lysylphosphatidylglycerol synthase domain-containing protein [Longimicrobiaceae bacterium]|nr:lysylphosphatidylglycerol synthase domain-containing protein [Longimicrobiaceae bacterium]